MAVTSRSEILHPDLGTAGGSALWTSINNIYQLLGDNDVMRYKEFSAIANSTVVELDHNFGATFDQLTWQLYTGTGTTKTQILDPIGAGWLINGKAGSLATVVEVTTPSSGGPHTFTLILVDGRTLPELVMQMITTAPSSPVAGTLKAWFDDNKRGLVVDSAGGIQPLSFLGTSYTSSSGSLTVGINKLIRSNIAATTQTLPASIADYDIIMVTDAGRNANTNNITIGRNGNTINGVAADYVIQENGGWVILIGDDTNNDWIVLAASQSGGGESGTNYFTNGTFETSGTAGVTAGGSVSPTIGSETSTPLFGTRSSKITSGAGTGFVDYAISGIDNAVITGQIFLGLTAYLKTPALGSTGDWTVGIYNQTDAAYVASVPQTNLTANTLNVFRGGFVPATGKTYSLRVQYTVATAGRDLIVDNLKLTFESSTGLTQTPGLWKTFTPTGSWTTNTTYTGLYRLDEDTLSVQVKVALAGAPTSANLVINMPSGFTIDTNKVINTTNSGTNPENITLGKLTTVDNGVQTYQGFVGYKSTTEVWAMMPGTAATYLISSDHVTQAVPFTYGSGDTITIEFSVPVVEWQAFSNLLTPSVVYSNARARVTLSSGSATTDGIHDFNTLTLNTGGFTASGSGSITVPAEGYYNISVAMFYSSNAASTSAVGIYKNGTATAKGTQSTGGNDGKVQTVSDVVYLLPTDTLTIRQENVNSPAIDTTLTYCNIVRVADLGAFSPISFGLATSVAAGLIPDYEVLDTNLDSGFTGSTAIRIVKIGKMVTITSTAAATHASASSVSTSAGWLPTRFRPAGTVGNTYGAIASQSGNQSVSLTSAGALTTTYVDFAGSGQNRTDTGSAINFSYNAS